MEITRQLNIDLTHAWLFILPYYIKERVTNSPFSFSTAKARLITYLEEMQANDRENLQGFRLGYVVRPVCC